MIPRPTPHSPNFYIGFEYPTTGANHGVIYLNGQAFANVWLNPTEGYPPALAGRWTLNRQPLAMDMNLPDVFPTYTEPQSMLEALEDWLAHVTTYTHVDIKLGYK